MFPSNQLKIVSLFEFVFLFQLYDSSIIDTEWKNVALDISQKKMGKTKYKKKMAKGLAVTQTLLYL